ncbi:MAG: hypothetical protein JNK58_07880 [Phycisphaerae bacterium]|nr:hypothetical protein [Phycisphaerae bacterium]
MKHVIVRALAAGAVGCVVGICDAHPSRSVAVLDDGAVIVPDAVRSVIWKVGTDGRVTPFARNVHTHWLCHTTDGSIIAEHLEYDPASERFSQSLLRISPDGGRVEIVAPAAGSARFSAFIVREDGSILHAPEDGTPCIIRRDPDGGSSIFVQTTSAVPFAHVTAMASGPNGTCFFTDQRGIFVLDATGHVSRLIEILPLNEQRVTEPSFVKEGELWGLSADDQGAMVVADPHARRVWRIDPTGESAIVFTSESPWFPTGVSSSRGRVYVVEHGLEGERNHGPRVRIVEADGTNRELATITE